MTTENLKAVLMPEEMALIENGLFPADTRAMIERLADEVVRLEAGDYMEGFEEGVASCQERIRELEAKLKAWEGAPYVRVVRDGKGQRFEFFPTIPSGTYHLKPKETQGDDRNGD